MKVAMREPEAERDKKHQRNGGLYHLCPPKLKHGMDVTCQLLISPDEQTRSRKTGAPRMLHVDASKSRLEWQADGFKCKSSDKLEQGID